MYALVESGAITVTYSDKPAHANGIGYPPDCPDSVYAANDIYPVTVVGAPVYDGYHLNTSALSVVNGMPVETWTVTEIPLAEAQARRIAEIQAEGETRYNSRWPLLARTASLGGVPLSPASPTATEDAANHLIAIEDAAAAVNACTSVSAILAVPVGWPV